MCKKLKNLFIMESIVAVGMNRSPIPLVKPIVGAEEIDAVVRVMKSGQLAQGEEVRLLEEEFAGKVGTKHAVAVNSGTAALHCALNAAGVRRGDEVVTTPFTFAATASPILMQGGIPKFVDVDPTTFNADIEHLSSAVTPRTRAVIGVDLFGLPLSADGIEGLRNKNVIVIEDACQAVGARRDNRSAGALCDVGCFSFYATKNIMMGEGGMLVTDDVEIAASARRFRQHGQGERYEYLDLGYNYRTTNILAAIGRVQLSRLGDITLRRQQNARDWTKRYSRPSDPASAAHCGACLPPVHDPDRQGEDAER